MKNELEILQKIAHPNIVRVYELLEDKERYYIIMELMMDGELKEYVQTRTYDSELGIL